jgi:hypothetical protein
MQGKKNLLSQPHQFISFVRVLQVKEKGKFFSRLLA